MNFVMNGELCYVLSDALTRDGGGDVSDAEVMKTYLIRTIVVLKQSKLMVKMRK